MVLNDDILETEKPDVKCLPTFVVNEFSGLFVYIQPFILNIQDTHK